jgi:outer membrane protein
VRKYLLPALAVAIVTCLASQPVLAQNNTAAPLPHKVGLIDMAHVFKNYKKFEALREALKSEIEAADREAQAKAGQIKKLQEELKSGVFKAGSADYNNLESQITHAVAEFESFRKQNQREFLEKEANLYKTVYLEVSETVALYARHYKYTLVLRFNRDKIQDAQDPKEILNSMNHQVVFHVPEDDITLSVLKYLNDRYAPSTASKPDANAPAGTRRNN